jgi:hypothetical protein
MAHSTQEHLALQDLPTELLVYIFSSLDCGTLLACQQVIYDIAQVLITFTDDFGRFADCSIT